MLLSSWRRIVNGLCNCQVHKRRGSLDGACRSFNRYTSCLHASVFVGMKRSPCNECREHKRRCTYEKPCLRCQKFDLECIYKVITSPEDDEYVKEMELLNDIEKLHNELDSAETNMKELEQRKMKNKQQYPAKDSAPGTNQQGNLIVQRDWVFATLNQSIQGEKPWELKVSNGKLVIRTFIKTHVQLLASLRSMTTALAFQDTLPLTPNSIIYADPSIELIRNLVFARFDKSRLKTMVKDLPRPTKWILQGKVITEGMIQSQHNIPFLAMTANILNAYLKCSQNRYMAVHAPTFVAMVFPHLRQSPSAMALCALSCTIQCRHIAQIIPPQYLAGYARFYYNRARELAEEQFDEITLEMAATYAFISFYKAKILETVEAIRYADMADRLLQLLRPENPGEDAMLIRLAYTVRRVRVMVLLIAMDSQGESSTYCRNYPDVMLYPAPGDSEKEARHIRLFGCIVDMREAAHEATQYAQSEDLQTFTGTFTHMVEMAMRVWYKKLPDDFKLSLPLFEDITNETEFFELLERDCKLDILPLVAILKLYNEYLVIAKAYMPKYSIVNEKDKPQVHYWQTKLKKLQKFRSVVGFEGNDVEYEELLLKTMRPESFKFDTSIAHNAVTVAFSLVRILQFLQTRASGCCYVQHRILLNIWEILMRAARFKYQRPKSKENTMNRIRANLLLILNMVQYQLKIIPSDTMAMDDTVKRMEQELGEQLL